MRLIFWLASMTLREAEYRRRERSYYCGNGFKFLGIYWGELK